jgi:hypothetical protein
LLFIRKSFSANVINATRIAGEVAGGAVVPFADDWVLADDAHIHFEDDLQYADLTEADLLADGYIKKIQYDGNAYFTKRTGDVWIGGRKGILSNSVKELNKAIIHHDD